MANKVEILGKEFEFFWSTQVVSDISEKCGGWDKLDDWLTGENVPVDEQYKRCTYLFEQLVNAAIKRDNYAIKHGFRQGEEKPLFDAGDFSVIIGINDLKHFLTTMIEAYAGDLNTIEIPDGVNIEKKEIDKTLEEIKDNRAKKEDSAE